MLSNLISNAIRYSPEGTDVEVNLELSDGRAVISVRDRGPGIPKEHRPSLFKRFYRATSDHRKTGLGLGLYISKGIVEGHGGRIWFETAEGKGSTFFVSLPISRD